MGKKKEQFSDVVYFDQCPNEASKNSKFILRIEFSPLVKIGVTRAVPGAGHLVHLPQAQQFGGAKLGI